MIGLLVWRTNQYSDFMFRGGLVVLSVATAATVAAVVTPGSLLGRALGCGPLRWIGVRSYGIYLWHYPVIVLTTAVGAAGAPVSLGRAAAIVAGTVAVAAVSWRFVEDPIRRGARLRWVTPDGASKPIKAKVTRGADMTGEPGTSTGGGGRPGWPRRPGLLRSPQAIGGVCLLGVAVLAAGVTASMRLTSATAHPAATHVGLGGERAAVQLRGQAGRVGPARARVGPQRPAAGRRASRRGRARRQPVKAGAGPAHRSPRRRRAGRGRARAADAAAADLVHVGGAHRRLHVRGADLRGLRAEPGQPDPGPLRRRRRQAARS